ncbi:MAG: hypothetical protein ACRBFS_12090 [Aureispira sp.]
MKKKTKKKSFIELQEEFTIAGFIAVSGWAVALFLQVGLVVVSLLHFLLPIFEIKGYYLLILYGILWLICFWLFCLLPKIKGEK